MGKLGDVSNDKGKVEERYPGELSFVTLSDKEMNDFIDYMSESYHGTFLDYLYSIIGPDKILLYLETLEDLTVKIPPKKTIAKIVFYVKVYNYVKSRGFTEEAYKNASRIFDKRVFNLKRVVNKVQTVLERYSKNEEL